ncbi:hypothetical protein [Parathalassolituus penaei]|uniref:1-aminocyclopropane-1-carboxylate deaminase n=1 Tax=Parathalassolituus penaei TaxID=2997323 RepID=A0A9X3EF17_9GAMM|nr:hypothetical protein [Parathalassolituus penaei]MCY0966393.1 hypothetical protein [Parathalassolituus penaei]
MRPGIDILRLDAIHPLLSGNKLFKVLDALERLPDPQALVSVGGVHSNHLHALAAIGYHCGIPVTGLVRGYANVELTPTLADCRKLGMQLVFLDRQQYRQRYEADFQQYWAQSLGAVWIGEGGALAPWQEASVDRAEVAGTSKAAQALAELCGGYDQVWLATGSGTTARMVLPVLPAQPRLMLVHTVADQGELETSWRTSYPDGNYQFVDSCDMPFGRLSPELRELLERYDALGLPLDPVYGVRLLAALEQWLQTQSGVEPRILLVHGGGLQGRRAVGLSWSGQATIESWLANPHLPASSVPVR